MGLIKNVFRGFRGGPDFGDIQTLKLSLEDTLLDITLPVTNLKTQEEPRPIHIPFLQKGWFESNSEQSRQHINAHIHTQMWYYVPSVAYPRLGELGGLSLQVNLKKIPSDKKLNTPELSKLGQLLITEYEEHYNSPTIEGVQGLGLNTKLRQGVIEQSQQRSEPYSAERLEKEVSMELAAFGYPPLKPYQLVTIKGRQWVFYIEERENSYTKSNLYCIPINDEFILCFRFKYIVDINDKFHLWKDHAETAEKRIMESVKLTFPSNEKALPSA